MIRPLGITISALLMVCNVVLDVVLSLTAPSFTSGHATPAGPSPIMMAIHFVLVAFIVVELVVVAFYWLGKPWARWGVLAGSIFYISGMRYLAAQWHRNHASAVLTCASASLGIFLIWYLYTRNIREWFARVEIARRSTARTKGANN